MVHRHVMFAPTTQRGLSARIKHHDVGVGTGNDLTLARMQPEYSCRCGAAGLHPPFKGDLSGDNALVDQLHAVLYPTNAVWYRGKSIRDSIFPIDQAERTMIGGDHREIITAETSPQITLMMLMA